jgi:gamma-glutamyltranspeptidase/glutathione hydrolase
MSVGPPAAAAGYAALADLGRLGRGRLAAPAIELAVDGFPWAPVCTRLSEQAAALVQEMNAEGCVYYPDGSPISPGTITRLPGLVKVLEEFVARGAGLMDGPVGSAVVAAVHARGGVLTDDDFGFARAEWATCSVGTLATTHGDVPTWATPSPTHGPSLLDAVAGLGSPNPSHVDVLRQVMKAISERRSTLCDPSGTSMVSAADTEGNVVVIVHSNSFPRFGSGIVRRPATTLHAWAVAGMDGYPRFMGATPGGANQMPWNAQTLARIARGETDPGVLVASPIWEWLPEDDGLRIESGFEPDDVESLRSSVPRVINAPRWGCKSAQQVVRVPRGSEAWVGAADPRTVGLALGV